MIVAIEGKVEYKEPMLVHINVAGITYGVFVSINTSSQIQNEQVRLLTTRIIREESDALYGFIDKDEKKMFDTLLKINGVGPKVALAVCSTFSPDTFAKVVASKDVGMLKRVPGIGPKAASRILVELADFIVDGNTSGNISGAHFDASLALESLGFKKDEAKKALQGLSGDTSSLVKEALKKLQRL
jgi:Holliday junction DNA helicase RuvA